MRVLAGDLDEATQRAVEYARGLGVADLRAVHFGGCDWDASQIDIPVDNEPLSDRLGESILVYVRRLTDQAGTAAAMVLPERIHGNLRLLRNRRALEIKRCLLFEPHVILSSVPFQA